MAENDDSRLTMKIDYDQQQMEMATNEKQMEKSNAVVFEILYYVTTLTRGSSVLSCIASAISSRQDHGQAEQLSEQWF